MSAPSTHDLDPFSEVWVARTYALRRDFVPRRGWCVVDCGANLGAYTLWAADHMRAGRLYAVEPIPVAAEYLRRNIEANQGRWPRVNIRLFPFALGKEPSNAEMIVLDGFYGRSRITEPGDSGVQVSVPVRPLDDLLGAHGGPVDILKVNVEGAEVDLFLGAKMTLRHTRRVVMEYHGLDRLSRCQEILDSVGLGLAHSDGWEQGMAFFQRLS